MGALLSAKWFRRGSGVRKAGIEKQALYGGTIRGLVPLQLIPGVATGWDRSISIGLKAWWEAKIPAGENEDT
jgi:hypothetical protein